MAERQSVKVGRREGEVEGEGQMPKPVVTLRELGVIREGVLVFKMERELEGGRVSAEIVRLNRAMKRRGTGCLDILSEKVK